MTPPNLTGKDLAAWHRSEADRIEAEERARRPALAKGQIWRWEGETYLVTCPTVDGPLRLANIVDGNRLGDDGGFEGEPETKFEYVGLARDVLRVVPPDPPAPQVAPEPTITITTGRGPTGAELVGRRCWVRDGDESEWRGPFTIRDFDEGRPHKYNTGAVAWRFAKPYVEGVAP